MEKGLVRVLYGKGNGKTACAVGNAIKLADNGKTTTIIQFLKGRYAKADKSFLRRLEPEIRLFSFDKTDLPFEELSKEEQKEAVLNIYNGLNFAKKVLQIGESDVVILDEVLGILDYGMIEADDIIRLIESKSEEVELILTGIIFPEELKPYVDEISRIETEET